MATVDEQLRDQADYLEALARAVRSINDWRAGISRDELQARLGLVPGATGQGLLGGYLSQYSGGVSAGQDGSSVANTLGNVQPWVGQANVLLDPTFETLAVGLAMGTTKTLNGRWSGHHVANSGATPTLHTTSWTKRRGDPDNNPFNTDIAELILSTWGAGAADTDLYLYPAVDFTPAGPTLPYLVASVRLYLFDALVISGSDTATATLEIFDGSSVVASSGAFDLKSIPILAQVQLVAAWQDTAANFHGKSWRWRVKLHVTKVAAADIAVLLRLAEPQLHFAYTPDPMPFVPAVANWYPAVRPADVQGIGAASDTIQPPPLGHGVLVWLVPNANYTMTSTPTIPDGIDGQEVILYNNTGNNIVLQDQGTLAGSNLRLEATTVTLGLAARSSVRLIFLKGVGDWVQIGPVVNVL